MQAYEMAGHLIRRLNQKSTHIFATRMQEAGYDLTPVQFSAMEAVSLYPGIDQASVAARIGYDRATIGGVIDRLQAKGYLDRTVSERDRRARVLRLTDAGQSTLETVLPIVRKMQLEILENLSEGERELFLTLARKSIGPVVGPED